MKTNQEIIQHITKALQDIYFEQVRASDVEVRGENAFGMVFDNYNTKQSIFIAFQNND
jgi:hypothetical protein